VPEAHRQNARQAGQYVTADRWAVELGLR
jgi:hypothetical protein